MQNIRITVSRRASSGGTYIASSVARKLGFKYLISEVIFKGVRGSFCEVEEAEQRNMGQLRLKDIITDYRIMISGWILFNVIWCLLVLCLGGLFRVTSG